MKRYIIFSDIDGTLMDHHTYSMEAAKSGLQLIAKKKIPLILTSSKSFAEMKVIHDELDLREPFIVENGGAVCVSTDYFEIQEKVTGVNGFLVKFLSLPYDEIISTLRKIKANKRFRFSGFNEMTIETVMSLTSLPYEKAQQAKTRLCSEPLVWEDTTERLQDFTNELSRHGFKLLKGGRFYHLIGNTDKAIALKYLLNLYKEKYPHDELLTIGVGDSPNDIEMLQAVNIPVLVQRPDGTYIDVPFENKAIFAEGVGPVGWNKAVNQILGDS